MGTQFDKWVAVLSNSYRSRWESLPLHDENIYLRFKFWIAVPVRVNVYWMTSTVAISFLALRHHPHAKFYACGCTWLQESDRKCHNIGMKTFFYGISSQFGKVGFVFRSKFLKSNVTWNYFLNFSFSCLLFSTPSIRRSVSNLLISAEGYIEFKVTLQEVLAKEGPSERSFFTVSTTGRSST
jgi:hypothetical protein